MSIIIFKGVVHELPDLDDLKCLNEDQISEFFDRNIITMSLLENLIIADDLESNFVNKFTEELSNRGINAKALVDYGILETIFNQNKTIFEVLTSLNTWNITEEMVINYICETSSSVLNENTLLLKHLLHSHREQSSDLVKNFIKTIIRRCDNYNVVNIIKECGSVEYVYDIDKDFIKNIINRQGGSVFFHHVLKDLFAWGLKIEDFVKNDYDILVCKSRNTSALEWLFDRGLKIHTTRIAEHQLNDRDIINCIVSHNFKKPGFLGTW